MANVTIADLVNKTAVATDEIEVQATGGGASNKVTALSLMGVASPTLTTPALGVATATSINKVAITAPATSATLTVADGKTLTASNTLTLTATDGSTLAVGTGGTLGTAAYTAATAYEVPLTFTAPITRTVNTVALDNTAVTPGSYTSADITVDAQGRITAAASGAGGGATLGANTFTALQTITQASANAGIIASTGYSLTGSDATSMVSLAGTLNTTGSPAVFKLSVTDTARGSSTRLFQVLSGAAGGTSAFELDRQGNIARVGAVGTDSGGYGGYISYISSGANDLLLVSGDKKVVYINSTAPHGLGLPANLPLTWTSVNENPIGTKDLYIGRGGAAATLQQGAANAASPVAQTLQSQGSRAGTDSNVGGASYTIQSGTGTGTGTESSLILRSPVAVASGTGAQTNTTGLTINRGTAVLVGYTVATLPTAPSTGATAYVTDATTPTYLGALTGGGAVVCPVFYNGSAWVSG